MSASVKRTLSSAKNAANPGSASEIGLFRPVKSNPGTGDVRENGHRDGASSDHPKGEPQLTTCPCCGGWVRIQRQDDALRVELARRPLIARGSHALAERVIELVCEANGVTVADLWPQNHDPANAAIRKRAAQAARASGAAASTIGEILHRNESTINKLAPKGQARR
jgi:hypothetical protein